MSELTVRTATEADFDDTKRLWLAAFLQDPSPTDDAWFRNEWNPRRTHCAFDGDEMVGSAVALIRQMTLPGTVMAPVAAVTSVAVKPGHRRRGALRMMMHAQLHVLHEQGADAFAALWASEGGIYDRFGYGLAANYLRTKIPKRTAFRPGVDVGTERVREVSREKAMPFVSELYDRVAPRRTGWLSRDEEAWAIHLWDTETHRKDMSVYKFGIHPDGYVIYQTKPGWNDRGPQGTLVVHEFVATTPTATAALWRHVLDYDLVGEITAPLMVDDPLPHLLRDPYQGLGTKVDSLWIRLVDLDRALVQRRYSAPVDVVFEVTDEFCPWNQGRWRLVTDSDGMASVERTTRDADLALDVTDLGAVFLGGTRLTSLADGGRVGVRNPAALPPATRAFAADQAPHCPEVF